MWDDLADLFLDTTGDNIWFLLIVYVLAAHLSAAWRIDLGSVYSLSFVIVMAQIAYWNMLGVSPSNTRGV
ncbi:MAG: hypothetical protein J7463_12105 [Roseiflexus sp.]|nr:hypothetical protein [Roseiflexus sp.]MBO9336510.1 hypothetical protein [Roseiflexus sp.]MBO9343172.1 hypothetical protein [Roseiflexus sp.]MBO9364239.1 hypothetical protein [Roseiflexus sp.]MBO9389943.1 hypothetical protein [Roseiflexus sp.]